MGELIETLEPMTIKDILIRSYRFYKNSFFKSIGIVLLLKGPYLILAYIIARFAASFFIGMFTSSEGSLANYEYMAGVLIIEILELAFIPFISPISISAITIFMSEKRLNRDIGVIESYRKVMKRALPLFGAVLMSGLIISSGFIFTLTLLSGNPQLGAISFLFAPVLAGILWVWYAFVPQTVVIEGEGGIGAMKRSKYLMNGYFRKVLILVVIVFIVILLVTWILSFSFGKMLFFLGDNSVFLGKGLSNVISVILEAFRIIVVPLLYYDLRVRKEGFNLETLAKEMEAEI